MWGWRSETTEGEGHQTRDLAIEAAEKSFGEKVDIEGLRNNQTVSSFVEIFEYEDEEVKPSEEVEIFYTHYHGDYAEHFRQGDYV